MSYAPSKRPDTSNSTVREAHRHIKLWVYELVEHRWQLVEGPIERTVMSNEGRQYVRYGKMEFQLKKLRQIGDEEFELKVRHW